MGTLQFCTKFPRRRCDIVARCIMHVVDNLWPIYLWPYLKQIRGTLFELILCDDPDPDPTSAGTNKIKSNFRYVSEPTRSQCFFCCRVGKCTTATKSTKYISIWVIVYSCSDFYPWVFFWFAAYAKLLYTHRIWRLLCWFRAGAG